MTSPLKLDTPLHCAVVPYPLFLFLDAPTHQPIYRSFGNPDHFFRELGNASIANYTETLLANAGDPIQTPRLNLWGGTYLGGVYREVPRQR